MAALAACAPPAPPVSPPLASITALEPYYTSGAPSDPSEPPVYTYVHGVMTNTGSRPELLYVDLQASNGAVRSEGVMGVQPGQSAMFTSGFPGDVTVTVLRVRAEDYLWPLDLPSIEQVTVQGSTTVVNAPSLAPGTYTRFSGVVLNPGKTKQSLAVELLAEDGRVAGGSRTVCSRGKLAPGTRISEVQQSSRKSCVWRHGDGNDSVG